MAVAVYAGAFAASAQAPVGAADGNKACGLLTPSELESVLGTKVTLMPSAAVELCTGRTPTGMVSLTVRETKTGAEADAGLAAAVTQAKQRGIQMDVKKFGPITCTTMSPMHNVKALFLTSCSVVKGTRAAVVEVMANSQQDVVSIEQLHLLAEKMPSRF
jgi:hypothetical protein